MVRLPPEIDGTAALAVTIDGGTDRVGTSDALAHVRSCRRQRADLMSVSTYPVAS
jgi:hypothetical protein